MICSKKLLLTSFFVTGFFLINGCQQTPKKSLIKKTELTSEESGWMAKFFNDLLFEEDGAYTLYGDKPMVAALLYYFTEEESQAAYEALPKELQETVEKVKYDFAENWLKWEKIKNRFPIQKYLFAKRCLSEDKKIYNGFFVNIAETAFILQEHYEDFKRVVGYDFSPFDEVFNIEDENSTFWKAVLTNHALQGILFGFGRKNSYLFQWMMNPDKSIDKKKLLETFFLQNTSDELLKYGTSNNEHFSLPIFRYYSSDENDRLLSKYKQQREKIKNIYKKGNFLGVTLERLTAS